VYPERWPPATDEKKEQKKGEGLAKSRAFHLSPPEGESESVQKRLHSGHCLPTSNLDTSGNSSGFQLAN
jgi:hypothetical protein